VDGKKIPLNEEAYYRIKQMLFNRKIVSGQRLVHKDLSDALKISRTPIINALSRLKNEGFLTLENYRGFYVKPLDIQEAKDLFGIREALETYAIEQAINLASDRDIETLEELARSHGQYMPPYYDHQKLIKDMKFHLHIGWMSRNQLLLNQLKINLEHDHLRFQLETNLDARRMLPAAQQHSDLVEKLKGKDILGCIKILRSHIRASRDGVIEALSKGEQSYMEPQSRGEERLPSL
jgi:DNA-binding GntR family transcriptional regulator